MIAAQLSDQAARDEALDIAQSFIVQAPAGSGKTGLLTLRFLRLLTVIEQPEQVLAITFTRKAASEMRARIVQTLFWAKEVEQQAITIENPYDQQRFQIASEVLDRDEELQWHLLINPSRLRIQTIDSFCYYLASQLPVLSQLGGNPNISEDVDLCFRDAIENTLLQLDADNAISADIECIQVHLDNDISRLERLLKDLLSKREQWLPYIFEIGNSSNDARAYLQSCLDELIKESVVEATIGLEPYQDSVIELTNFALENLQQAEQSQHDNIEALSTLPSFSEDDMERWGLIVNLLLTQSGSWRRVVDKRNGFPAGEKEDKDRDALCKLRKQQFAKLRDQLLDNDDLLESVNYLRLLPKSSTDDQQWEFLSSLTRVLAQLSSELLLSFRRYRVIDYTEIGAAARAALGTDTAPTDLALALDHNIQHILVDEFQDTSQLQLDILQQLTAGWEQDDQHSLFLVGDAMQSCYSFRNANVGIYLNVQQNGLHQVKVKALELNANFRSDAGIVDWVNRHFITAFPHEPNSSRGAVPYTSSTAVNPAAIKEPVSTEIITYGNSERLIAREAEALKVVEHIKAIRNQSQRESIAILVRSRGHLDLIIQELRNNNIEWESTDIDRMGAMQIIEDLLSLTRALLNPYDHLSWLALLRAPWLGLQLLDVHTIAQHAQNNSVWDALNNPEVIASLTDDGRARLKSFVEGLSYGMKYRFRTSLRYLVETTWCLLRGPAAMASGRDIACAAHYFNLLSEQEIAGSLDNIGKFHEQVFDSFIPAQTQRVTTKEVSSVQLLTMHKAKGLEFDHVIIPGLANRPRSDDKPLFSWLERLNNNGQNRLFVSALTATGAEEDSLYTLMRHEKQHKTMLENTRLLYIAITRAKKSVKLFATAQLNSKQELQIPSQSLLNRLWRELQREALELQITPLESVAAQCESPGNYSDPLPSPTPLKRFSNMPELNESERGHLIKLDKESDFENLTVDEDHAIEQALSSQIGQLIHNELEHYANREDKASYVADLAENLPYWELQIRHIAPSKQILEESLKFIASTVRQTVLEESLDWIFDNKQTDCQSEYSITSLKYGKMQTHIVDRTLVDSNNVRWIIDYKTGVPGNEDESEFIEKQQTKYQPQLQRYKDLFNQLETRETKTALLFTAIPKLVEV